RLIVGLADGKIRLASCKHNKCSTLYRTDVFVASIALQPTGRSFVSGHSDGSVILFSFESRSQSKIFTHQCPPYALAFTSNGILAAGCDQRVVSYTESGRVLQQFDYSSEQKEKEFTVAIRDPSGQNVVVGSFDRVRLFTWNQRRGALDEGKPLEIQYLYTISALTWSPDGSTIAVGTLCGSVITLDCCLRRSLLKGHFEITYVASSHVLINDINSQQRISIRSSKGYPIDEIKVMGRDRFVVAYTPNSLIVADMITEKSSEVTWQSAGNERFFFDNENVCLIVNAGEVNLVEYGIDEVIGWIRTELISPHLLSVRLTERKQRGGESIKRIAYLLDVNTISVVDLLTNTQLIQISHPVAIDWLELSETATKLLYRDRRSRLSLIDLDSDRKTTLLSYCTYVQWVPKSDVIVAQSGEQLCVWYQADNPEQMVMVPIKGDIETVLRDEERTEVIVEEANAKVAYELDQTLIEFATALDNQEFGRAVDFLERRDDHDADALWRQLAQVAVDQQQLLIAQRCYAALGDVSRVKMLADTIRIADEAAQTVGGDGRQYYKVRARLALMRKDFKEAERIYLEQSCLDEAIEMYQNIHKWEEALELARARNYPDFESLKARYYRSLFDSGQDEKAAEISEREGDLETAIDLYLKANLGAHAARVLLSSTQLLVNEDLVQKVAVTLVRAELFEKAGDLFEKTKDFERALECFRKGKCFAKAIQLARISFPERVVPLEEEWGDSLVEDANYDAAINHFLESGKSAKALEASIRAKQWSKAAQIADVLEDSALAKQYYGRIADHHAAAGDLELAAEFLGQEETQKMYGKLAHDMEEAGRLNDAEQLYISIGQPNKAIAMYKKVDRIDEMMALVEKYHSEHVQETHKHIAGDLEERGDLKAAEEQYLKAGDWKSAVNMYRAAEEWNDAYRIAKQEGGDAAQKQVAYLWAKSLGGDSAVKLLQKFNLLDESIDFACENGAFDFAFELCRLGAKARLPFVHLKLAQQLEEEGQFENAEKHYIEGGKPKEAVLMYVHDQDWDNAERLAKEHCEDSLSDVFIGQARVAIEQKDFPRAESYLLRANRADIILRYYKEMAMWPDALRIAKDYIPAALPQLQEEYEDAQLKSGAKGALSFMAQGRDWETQGEYLRAVQCYLKVQEPETTDINMIVTALTRAGDLTTKFLSDDESAQIIDEICERLLHYRKFTEAAEVFMSANRPDSAIKAFVLAGQWAKAKKVATELQPEMADFVDEKYKESLRNEGRVGELIDVDAVSAIDLLIEKGLWEKALETAKQQNYQPLMDKYVALYATKLISQERFADAIEAFEKYGASSNPHNFNIYQRLISQVMNSRLEIAVGSYEVWSHLRNMLLLICESLDADSSADDEPKDIFGRYLYAAHYGALRCALSEFASAEMEEMITQICISLLRYSDLIAADKVFYEAGIACRKQGGRREKIAFVLLNHYLDLNDAIEEQDPSLVDASIFEGTDIPQEVPLPETTFLTKEEHEEVKEWVLAISMEQSLERALPLDSRGNFEGSLVDSKGVTHKPCIITGYAVYEGAKEFGGSGKVANKDAWNKFVMAQKTKPSESASDVQQFIARWTGTPLSLSL
uniref:Intraflagellar transport protein osm-1 n=1 Tax=Parascaris univalens TaxID=6257 RepID=A0A915BZY3_PARUN